MGVLLIMLEPIFKTQLLQLALASIQHGLTYKYPKKINATEYSNPLQEKRATFVTLLKNKVLRGCIGTLEAKQSLAEDVVYHAYAAAFQDPRFSPLKAVELETLSLSIAILSLPKPLIFSSEAALIQQLQIGIDGLILQEGYHKATFLPSVWEQFDNPKDFLFALKRKAGLSYAYWSENIKFFRYTTESFSECVSNITI